jgi:uncharacterized SAM-binding protein YcdF (DUF218 family)
MALSILPRRSPWIAVSIALSLLAVTGIGVWAGRTPLLRGAANAWIVSDPVGPADAVVVLGGGLEVRPFAAADYYRKGLVSKVLLASVRTSPSEKLGISPSHVALNRSVLTKLGVPETAIATFGDELSNTYQESIALREWAGRNRASRLIIPTEIFSSRRVQWMFSHTLAGTGTHVLVPALDTLEYKRDEWWREEQGVIAFQNEVAKYVYYRFKYRDAK